MRILPMLAGALVASATASVIATEAAAQFPPTVGSPSIAPTAVSGVLAARAPGESFSLFLSSTVQGTPLTLRDSTAGATQTYTGSVTLTPTWDLQNNRQITIYAYLSQPFINGAMTLASTTLEASATGGSGSANGIWTAFGSTVDGHGSAVTLTQLTVFGSTKKVDDASERLTVGLRMNTSNVYVQPGLYTGIVTFGARIQ